MVRILKMGDSLRNFEKPSRSILRVILINNRYCLVKEVSANEAEVLYREVKEGNQPSRGYLKLENFCLASERIWSKDTSDYQEFGGEWDNQLNSVGIK